MHPSACLSCHIREDLESWHVSRFQSQSASRGRIGTILQGQHAKNNGAFVRVGGCWLGQGFTVQELDPDDVWFIWVDSGRWTLVWWEAWSLYWVLDEQIFWHQLDIRPIWSAAAIAAAHGVWEGSRWLRSSYPMLIFCCPDLIDAMLTWHFPMPCNMHLVSTIGLLFQPIYEKTHILQNRQLMPVRLESVSYFVALQFARNIMTSKFLKKFDSLYDPQIVLPRGRWKLNGQRI